MTDGAVKKNGMATAAMVLGIISLALFWTGTIGLIVGVVAIILAVVAKNQIKADPAMAGSAGQAKGGMIMGIIGAVLGLLWILLFLWVFSAATSEFENNLRDLEELNMQLDEYNN